MLCAFCGAAGALSTFVCECICACVRLCVWCVCVFVCVCLCVLVCMCVFYQAMMASWKLSFQKADAKAAQLRAMLSHIYQLRSLQRTNRLPKNVLNDSKVLKLLDLVSRHEVIFCMSM